EPRPSGRGRLLRTLSDLAVIEALARNQGNKTKAALELGFSREGLRKRLAKIGPGLARGLKP
ncbi:MAG: helix-turn-helix domain-containing protein, partial [Deltaproteobacteria bacterium]|nr:helix-turn-helix domain-containing protein [Deltaproteobacteria bacterium]